MKISLRDTFSAIPKSILLKRKQEIMENAEKNYPLLVEYFKNTNQSVEEYYNEGGDGANGMLDWDWMPDVKDVFNRNEDNELGALISRAREKGQSDKTISQNLRDSWDLNNEVEVHYHYGTPNYSIYSGSQDEVEWQVEYDDEFEKLRYGMSEEKIKEAAADGETYYSGGCIYVGMSGHVYGAVLKPGSSGFESFKQWVEDL